MTMQWLLRCAVRAYRPMYLQGLLLDGRAGLPATRGPHDPAPPPAIAPRRRVLPVALTGFGRQLLAHRPPQDLHDPAVAPLGTPERPGHA